MDISPGEHDIRPNGQKAKWKRPKNKRQKDKRPKRQKAK